MDRSQLIERWQDAFGLLPPPHTHASFMRLALAWQHQANGRQREAIEAPVMLPKVPKRSKLPLRPGTRLVREWQGTTYHVQVTRIGFEYEGQSYRSLSAIARIITGTQWSGPAFFGVGQ